MKRAAKEDLEHWEHLYKHRHFQENFYPSKMWSSAEFFNILSTLGDFKKLYLGSDASCLVVPRESMRTALDILSMIVEGE